MRGVRFDQSFIQFTKQMAYVEYRPGAGRMRTAYPLTQGHGEAEAQEEEHPGSVSLYYNEMKWSEYQKIIK